MEKNNLEAVKELIERIADSYDLPSDEQVQKMQTLTGVDWCPEALQMMCFEYWSRSSLEETAYCMFHQKLPTVIETELAFWRCKPGAVLDAETVFNKYRLGGRLETLEILPEKDILEAFRTLPEWTEMKRYSNGNGYRFDSKHTMEYWQDIHFRVFPYSTTDHEWQMIKITCQDVCDEEIAQLITVMEKLNCPLQLRKKTIVG